MEENNYENLEVQAQLAWKLKLVFIVLALWKVKLSLLKYVAARRRRPLRRLWIRFHNTEEKLEHHSWYNTTIKEAAINDQVAFFYITRMSATTFEDLLLRLGTVESLHKQDTKYRKCIPLGNNICKYLQHFSTSVVL